MPLTLRPQHFWLALVQAVAMHVEGHAEELQDKFVNFQGKVTLELDVTQAAVEGIQTKHWVQAVEQLNTLVAKNVKPGVYEVLSCANTFSNTLPVEQTAAGMAVMDVCKSYFDYKMMTSCGFPKITLEGTEEDWNALHAKAKAMVRTLCMPAFAEQWWPALDSVLGKLSEARGERVDVCFWESMAKRGGTTGSGSRTWISGWINMFYPLTNPTTFNPFCVPFGGALPNVQAGLETADFPDGLCSVPVTLDDHPLEFRSGFVGVTRDSSGEGITPCIGWFVASGKVKRTKSFFPDEAIDVEDANEILTRIGTSIPLEDFAHEPRAFARARYARNAKETQNKVQNKDNEILNENAFLRQQLDVSSAGFARPGSLPTGSF